MRQQALADADRLAVLNVIWSAETSPARHQRLRDLYLAALPPGNKQEPGQLAGLDAVEALAAAIAVQRRDFARHFAERADYMLHAATSGHPGLGTMFPARADGHEDAIPQPPKPQIQPSPRILERAAGHDPDMEAAGQKEAR